MNAQKKIKKNRIKTPSRKGRSVMDRKIARNMLKKEMKTNRIRDAWRQMQIKKYGLKDWFKKLKASSGGRVTLAQK